MTDVSDAEVATFNEMRALLRSTEGLEDMMPASAIASPEEGQQLSARSPQTLNTLSSAMVNVAKKGAASRLKDSGMNADVYAQAFDSPGFMKMLQRKCVQYIIAPRLPDIINAHANKAAEGDRYALSQMMSLVNMLDEGDEENQVRALLGQDDQTYAAMLHELISQLTEELSVVESGTTLNPETAVAEARRLRDSHKDGERIRVEVDHSEIHGADEK